jgi:hypothetical protein
MDTSTLPKELQCMNVWEVIGEKINNIRAALFERFFASGAKPFVFAVLGLLLVFAAAGIAVLVFGGRGKADAPAKNTAVSAQKNDQPFVFMHELLPPSDGFSLAQPFSRQQGGDYRLFRPRVERWDEEEAAKWWTQPDKTMLDQLHVSNNALIQTVLEAAP